MAGGNYKVFMGGHSDADFPRKISDVVSPPFSVGISGEIAASRSGIPIGGVRYPGRVVGVTLSVLGSGKNNGTEPTLTGNVKINGVSCLTTRPIVAHVSGEAVTNKTTANTSGTGITQAVINQTANYVDVGDIITVDFIYSGNTSPTTKMHNAVMMVEIDPFVGI